jgi:hypothetical protein
MTGVRGEVVLSEFASGAFDKWVLDFNHAVVSEERPCGYVWPEPKLSVELWNGQLLMLFGTANDPDHVETFFVPKGEWKPHPWQGCTTVYVTRSGPHGDYSIWANPPHLDGAAGWKGMFLEQTSITGLPSTMTEAVSAREDQIMRFDRQGDVWKRNREWNQ